QHLDTGSHVLDDAGLQQGFRSNLRTLLEPVQPGQVEHREPFLPAVVKAAQLGRPHRQPGLAALERLRQIHRGARALPLLTSRRGLAVARSRTAADPLARVVRPRRWLKLVELHTDSSTLTRCRTLCTMPRNCGLSSCSTVWFRRRKPSACTVRSWSGFCPITLRT